MEVTFVRVPETVCEGVVRFDDGRVFSVRSPGALRAVPPHDLGQFVVEHELGWQTGFWGYVTRGVLFPGVTQTAGRRAFHGDERSRAAIRGAKDLLAEVEMLAGVVGAIALAHADDDPDHVAAMLRDTWWPPHSQARQLPLADIRRACRAFREVEREWRALELGDSLRFRWSRRRHPLAPENPLDGDLAKRRARR